MAKPGVAARRAAVRLLDEVLDKARPLSELAEILEPLEPAERARAQRLASTTLRQLGPADAMLQPLLRKEPPLFVRNVLRLAVVELCHEGAASHGVVDSAVSLVRGRRKSAHLSGLVNAVLRRVSADGCDGWADLPVTRLPAWLRSRLAAQYGEQAVQAMEQVQADDPPLDLTPKAPAQAADLMQRLTRDQASAFQAQLMPGGSVRLRGPAQVSALAGYETGDWWVQDHAAAWPVRVLQPLPGEKVLDLCAAPGGKTMQIAAAGADVTALDLSAERAERLRQNLRRTGLGAHVVVGDALSYDSGPFDAILLDAPCSATGTIRRHPDLPRAKGDKDIGRIARLQARMIDHALGLLKPGGRLVYCVCSLLPQEGEAQVAAALTRHAGLRVAPVPPLAGLAPEWAAPDGGLRLRPDLPADHGGMDGFYIARLEFAGDTPGGVT